MNWGVLERNMEQLDKGYRSPVSFSQRRRGNNFSATLLLCLNEWNHQLCSHSHKPQSMFTSTCMCLSTSGTFNRIVWWPRGGKTQWQMLKLTQFCANRLNLKLKWFHANTMRLKANVICHFQTVDLYLDAKYALHVLMFIFRNMFDFLRESILGWQQNDEFC